MSYGLAMTIMMLAAVGILLLRLTRGRGDLQGSISEDQELTANRKAALLIGEHFVLSDKHNAPASRKADEGHAEGARPASSGKRMLKIAS